MIDPLAVTKILAERPEVADAVVADLTVGGRTRAVAVAAVEDYVGAPALREQLWQALGDDAPDGVLVLDRIPRAGDDLDLAALAAAAAEQGPGLMFEPAGDDTERRIAAIWAGALDLGRVGVHDDFLDLGGDSIAAVRILSGIEQEFGAVLDLHDLLNGTVRTIAEAVRSGG